MSVSIELEPIEIINNISQFIKQRQFKKRPIRLIMDKFTTELERSDFIIEGIWDGWVNHPPGIFLKDAITYDGVFERSRNHGKYVVKGSTPDYSTNIIIHKNVVKKGDIFVSAHSIKWIEFIVPTKAIPTDNQQMS